MSKNGMIFCDLDGTLAYHESGYNKTGQIGEPIPLMQARILQHLKEGDNVQIFTARLSSFHSKEEIDKSRKAIEDWCQKYLGQKLIVTAEKHPHAFLFYDDKAVGVIKNTGILIGK